MALHPSHHQSEIFQRFAKKAAQLVGSSRMFVLAIVMICTWLLTGPLFGFTTEWQLFINTFTTITTFLMVFVIQNTENRDTAALHLKLNELIRIHKDARNTLLSAEELSDHDIRHLRQQFHDYAREEMLLRDRAEADEPHMERKEGDRH